MGQVLWRWGRSCGGGAGPVEVGQVLWRWGRSCGGGAGPEAGPVGQGPAPPPLEEYECISMVYCMIHV